MGREGEGRGVLRGWNMGGEHWANRALFSFAYHCFYFIRVGLCGLGGTWES